MKHLSTLDKAYLILDKANGPLTLQEITKAALYGEGINGEAAQLLAPYHADFEANQVLDAEQKLDLETQFILDFMISGLFVYCGPNSDGDQVWDIKQRQALSVLEKSSYDIEYIEEHQQEIEKNILRDDFEDLEEERDEDEDEESDDDGIEDEVEQVASTISIEEADIADVDDDFDDDEVEENDENGEDAITQEDIDAARSKNN